MRAQLIFRGYRSRIGIYTGPIDRVTPHVKTGRADYFGQPVNRAARLMSAAHGGQIVCDRALMETVAEEWSRRYGVKRDIEAEPISVQPGAAGGSSATAPDTPHVNRLASMMAGTRTSSQDAASMRSGSSMLQPPRLLLSEQGAAGLSDSRRSRPPGTVSTASIDQQGHGGSLSPRDSEAVTVLASGGDSGMALHRDVRLARSFVGGSSFTKCVVPTSALPHPLPLPACLPT